jgi:hypothetical protein
VRGRRSAPLFALLALVAAGCAGGDDRRPETGPLSRTELGWIRSVDAWERALYRRLDEALVIRDLGEQRLAFGSADPDELARYRGALVDFLDCSETLRRELPESPSRRLEPTRAALARACRQLEKAARGDARVRSRRKTRTR